jgi:hypothetical protein
MSNPKEVAIALSTTAKEKGVRFPKIWDDSQIVLSCGAVLVCLLSCSCFKNAFLKIHSYSDDSQKR